MLRCGIGMQSWGCSETQRRGNVDNGASADGPEFSPSLDSEWVLSLHSLQDWLQEVQCALRVHILDVIPFVRRYISQGNVVINANLIVGFLSVVTLGDQKTRLTPALLTA